MVDRFRQLFNLINKKNAMFQYAKQIVENTTEKAQNKFSDAQNVAAEKYDVVVKVSIKYIISKQNVFISIQHFFLLINVL